MASPRELGLAMIAQAQGQPIQQFLRDNRLMQAASGSAGLFESLGTETGRQVAQALRSDPLTAAQTLQQFGGAANLFNTLSQRQQFERQAGQGDVRLGQGQQALDIRRGQGQQSLDIQREQGQQALNLRERALNVQERGQLSDLALRQAGLDLERELGREGLSLRQREAATQEFLGRARLALAGEQLELSRDELQQKRDLTIQGFLTDLEAARLKNAGNAAKTARDFGKDFAKRSEDWETISSQHKAAVELLKDPENPQGGQALVVLFQKILDPNSVVRESEFARTFNFQGLADQIDQFVKLKAEGRFDPTLLNNIMSSVDRLTLAGAQAQKERREKVSRSLTGLGIDPTIVFDLGETEDPNRVISRIMERGIGVIPALQDQAPAQRPASGNRLGDL